MIVLWILLAILVIAFMILTHEAGHFFAARAVGVRATDFSIGFGKEIKGWDRKGTHFAIRWIMAGGYVKILGMNPEEEVSEEDFPHSYKGVSYWRRAVIIVAGSAVHIFIAMFIFYLLFWPIGQPVQDLRTSAIGPISKTYQVSENGKTVTVQAPSFKAGLQRGDNITSVNGVPVKNWDELTAQLTKYPGQTVTLVVQRGKQTVTKTVQLLDINGQGKLGVMPNITSVRTNPVSAVWESVYYTGWMTGQLVKGVGSLFTLSTFKVLVGTAQRNPQSSPRSVIGAAQLAGQAAHIGIRSFLLIMGELFLFLALFNLIPLPPFDGGHLLVIVIEKISGKEVDMRKLQPIAYAVIIILSLMALRLMYLDIFKPLPPP